MQYTRSACAYCSFVWTKEPKATATRKSRGRTLGGLKRAPGAVLQAKRPRFPDGRAGNNLLGKGFGRGIRNTSCSCFGPSVALLRLRPASPISARRETHVSPASHMKIGYRTSFPSLFPSNQSRRISPMILVCTKIRLRVLTCIVLQRTVYVFPYSEKVVA